MVVAWVTVGDDGPWPCRVGHATGVAMPRLNSFSRRRRPLGSGGLPRRGRSAAGSALGRLRPRLWPIAQTAAAAVLAWYLAALLLGTERPVFASIAAVISIGATLGQRRDRALELIGGVVVGIAVADLLVQVIGTGPLQIGVMITLAMGTAVVLGGGPLVVTEAGVSALLLAALEPAGPALPPVRFLEALIGGGVALVVSAVLFPPDPNLLVSRAARSLFDELARALAEVADALTSGDAGRARQALEIARAADDRLDTLEDALGTARESARLAPTQRGTRAQLESYGQTLSELGYAVRNTRVLARHSYRYIRSRGAAPAQLADAVRDLHEAASLWALASGGGHPDHGDHVRDLARSAARRATEVSERHPDFAVAGIAAQVRSIAVDLIRASTPVTPEQPAPIDSPTEELLIRSPEPPPQADGG